LKAGRLTGRIKKDESEIGCMEDRYEAYHNIKLYNVFNLLNM